MGFWRKQPDAAAYQYTALDKNEGNRSIITNQSRRIALQNNLILGAVFLVILPIVLYISWSEYTQNTSIALRATSLDQTYKPFHCGDSVETAKKLGCVFDPLTYLWMPPACYDFQTSREFEHWLSDEARVFGPWPFFKDTEELERLQNSTALGEYTEGVVRASQEEHIAHCIFMAKSARHALEKESGFRLNPIYTLAHFEHCASELLKLLVEGPNPLDRRRLTTRFRVGFGSC